MKWLSIVFGFLLLSAGPPAGAADAPIPGCTLHSLQKPCFVPMQVVASGIKNSANVTCVPGNPKGFIVRLQAPPRQLRDDGLFGSVNACLYTENGKVKGHFWGWLTWGCEKQFDVPDVALENQENISLHIYDTCREPIGVRMGNTVQRDAKGKPIGIGIAIGAYASPEDELHGGKLVSPWLMGGMFPIP